MLLNVTRGCEQNEVEWTRKVEIRKSGIPGSRQNMSSHVLTCSRLSREYLCVELCSDLLQAFQREPLCQAMFWPAPSFPERTFVSSYFLTCSKLSRENLCFKLCSDLFQAFQREPPCQAMFWPAPGITERTVDSDGFSVRCSIFIPELRWFKTSFFFYKQAMCPVWKKLVAEKMHEWIFWVDVC